MTFLPSFSTRSYMSTQQQLLLKNDNPIDKCKEQLKFKTISVLGYGPQGKAQALNLRDHNLNVILGLRRGGPSWEKAIKDNWRPDIDLLDIAQATYTSDIVKVLLSDVGQIEQWNTIKNNLNENNTLYFSHGFGIHYNKYTNINPPKDIDIIMVSPKCSGNTVRKNFLSGEGVVSSYAIYQDHTKEAYNNCKSLGFLIGNNYMFQTTFEKEVLSDLTGERCILMGMIQAAFVAQYKVLKKHGHSPLEAYHETVYEALNSLYPLINDKGMSWLYKNCSTTAQRGAIDWSKTFEKQLIPMIDACYHSVKSDAEVKRVIECNSDPSYRIKLDNELQEIENQELWEIDKHLRIINKDQ
uniref:Ketol-acid reductoisomerase n=1 Tax=viral metagenome TaxID=1070528 RepID=A0A6C0J3N7_9ZZZZ